MIILILIERVGYNIVKYRRSINIGIYRYGKAVIQITHLTQSTFCVCPKPEPVCLMAYLVVIFVLSELR